MTLLILSFKVEPAGTAKFSLVLHSSYPYLDTTALAQISTWVSLVISVIF
jgi:hypothetical protein